MKLPIINSLIQRMALLEIVNGNIRAETEPINSSINSILDRSVVTIDRFRGGRGKWIANGAFFFPAREKETKSHGFCAYYHRATQCSERFYQQGDVLQCKTSNGVLTGHRWSTIRSETIGNCTRASFVSHTVLRFPDGVVNYWRCNAIG